MTHNFYRGPEAGVVAGSANFASLLASSFASYGISSAQATAFGVLNAALQSAYAAAVEPVTRTSVAVARKNQALSEMRAGAILLARIISATPTVSDAQLVSLGLLPRRTRTRIPAPATAPMIDVGVVTGRLVNLRLHSADFRRRRGIEPGAKGANLYSFVGDAEPTDPRDYHFEGMTTRTITQVTFPNNVASGATVWLCACWVSDRGETGPTSAPVNVTLQGGAVLPRLAA